MNLIGNARQEADSTELTTSSNKHNFCCMTCMLPKTAAIDLSHREDLNKVQFYIPCIDGSKVRNSMKIPKSRLKNRVWGGGTKRSFFGKRNLLR